MIDFFSCFGPHSIAVGECVYVLPKELPQAICPRLLLQMESRIPLSLDRIKAIFHCDTKFWRWGLALGNNPRRQNFALGYILVSEKTQKN